MKYAIFNPITGTHSYVEGKEETIQQRKLLIEQSNRDVSEYTVCEIVEHETGDATWVPVDLNTLI
jgi:hypothetical protein